MLDLGQLDVPADWEQLPSKDRVQFHMKNMAMQLDQVETFLKHSDMLMLLALTAICHEAVMRCARVH